MKKRLSELPVGAKGKITGFYQDSIRCRERLASMGLTPNTVLEILRIAPMGDPVEIKVRGYMLSLRLDEARSVVVEEV
ncbi:Ferrous iron transport protein A [Dissulfuribacter thermophilus]|uniref:Ferrous iron transport protein A n=1 Tax=Dissulfuribacter thermophilus TaxID=1156395 RepID=A0A1B9F643_9BACT|nr:FeoA family protein [Dissulfuribacter thermophilus]OCC15343.1 Ferrous iron transport protein A [Dissulfuribacter thermophilus]